MAKITITRSSEWNNRLRAIGIYADGKKIGTVANGETRSFDLPAGTHTLRAKIDWAGSPEVSFILDRDDQRKYFRLSGYKGGKIIAPLVLAIVVMHIIIRRTTGFDQTIWLAGFPFLYMTYFITFGRNRYLRLEEKPGWETD